MERGKKPNSLCFFFFLIFKFTDPILSATNTNSSNVPSKMASRYNSYDSRSSVTSSIHSDLSSSAEFKSTKPVSSKAVVRSKSSYLTKTTKPVKPDNNPGNLTYMMKKLMEMKKSNSKSKRVELVIPEELQKIDTGKGGKSTLGTLQRKLFGKEKVKPLTEVKGNTRTLSMVLRSERELLSMNKDQEVEIAELKLQLEDKNREVKSFFLSLTLV